MTVLQTLGGLRLHGTDLSQRLPLLVLAYLVIEGPTERQRLRGLFWPEAQSQGNNPQDPWHLSPPCRRFSLVK